MKKILSLVLAFVLAFSMVALVACNNDTTNENNNTNNENNENNTAEKSYTLSIAVDEGFGSVSKSKVTNIALAIVFDEAGKIVAARFDSVEASFKVTEGELATSDRLTTKVEKGEGYTGMNVGSWQQQADAFEKFLVGKTAAEVAALAFVTEGADASLVAGCTMKSSMPVFQTLVAKAAAYANKVTFKTAETVTLGLAVDAKLTGSVEDGAKVAADFAAVAIAGGKVVASMLDSAEGTYAFTYNEESEAYDVAATYKGSKNDQGTNYDAFSPMPSGTWYVQAQNFANTTVGKTVAELEGVSTDKIEGSCSIYTGGYKATIVRAAGYAN